MKISYGVCCGIVGSVFCVAGLLADVLSGISADAHLALSSPSELLRLHHLPALASGQLDAVGGLRQLLLLIGAVFLFVAAMTKGKNARLFQILEGALIIYGCLSFLDLPTLPAYLARFAVSIGMFVLLWQFDFLKGEINKVGALGLELLGIGYMFGSHWWLMGGGILLTIYCAYWQYREPGALNVLWTALNGPFGMSSAMALLLQYHVVETLYSKVAVSLSLIVIVGGLLPFAVIAHLRGPHRGKGGREIGAACEV